MPLIQITVARLVDDGKSSVIRAITRGLNLDISIKGESTQLYIYMPRLDQEERI
jgi:phenylpyruvate tautomerase PptA (4-oxalocrotonate tautomerase family)